MARLEIDLQAKGFTVANRDISKTTVSVEKLNTSLNTLKSTISTIDFSRINTQSLSSRLSGLLGTISNVTNSVNQLNRATTGNVGGSSGNNSAINQSRLQAQLYRQEVARLQAALAQLRLTQAQNRQTNIAASDSITGLRSRLSELTARYNSLSESQRNSASVQRNLIPEIQRLNNLVSQQRGNILAVNGSYAQAQQRLSALGAAIRNTAGGFNNMTPALRAQIAEYRRLNDQLQRFDRQMGNNQRNVGNYLGALSAISPQLGILTGSFGALVAAGMLVRDATKTIFDFDSGLRNVEKTTGLTTQEISKLGDEFIKLSRRLQTVSANSLTQYATVAGQLGVKGTENILAFTEALAKLETASNITGEQGGAEIARTLTLVDGGVQNVRKFADEIVNLGNNFPATEKEILANAEAIAQNVGIYRIGRQEVLAFATATKSVGIEAELVGSTFNRTLAVFEKAIRTGSGLQTVLKLVGGTQESLSKRFKEDASGVFVDFIRSLNLIDRTGGSVNEQLENLGINAVRDQRVIQSLAVNGYDVLTRSLETVRGSVGSLDKEFETASGKLVNQVGRVKIAWDNFILSVENGEGAFGQSLAKMSGGLADFIDLVAELQKGESFFGNLLFGRSNEQIAQGSARYQRELLSRNKSSQYPVSPINFMSGSGLFDRDFLAYRERIKDSEKATKSLDDAQSELGDTVTKNKQYWEGQVDSIKATIEAMDVSKRSTKEWAQAQKELADAQRNLDLYSKKTLTGDSTKQRGKTQAEIIREANEALSRGQVGALNGIDAELLKIDNKYDSILKKINLITDATLRGQLASVASVNKQLEISQTKLDAWLKTYKKNGFSASGVTDVTNNTIQSSSINQLPLLQRNQERFGVVYGKQAVSNLGANSEKEEQRISRIVERGLRSGFSDVFNSIDDLGSNFYEVFSNTFSKLASTVTNTFGQVIATQLGSLLNNRISDENFDIAGLGSTGSKVAVAGAGLLGGVLSGQGQRRNNAGLTIAGGALSGAAAGLAFGPWGALIGGVVGAIAGIFSSAGAKKQEKIQEAQLAEQRKQTALAQRQEALAYGSSIIGQQTTQGIVTGYDRSATGEIEFIIQGKTLKAVLAREENSR